MNILTQKRLKELLDYNPITGRFTWTLSTSNRVKKGSDAGSITNNRYVEIGIDGGSYTAHRLAFLYMLGYFPENDIDHKNGIRNDNRWCNLRHVTRSCNSQNRKLPSRNSSGFIGVYKHSKNNSWIANIKIGEKRVTIGSFNSPELAAVARVNFENNCYDWKCNHIDHNRTKLRSLGYFV